MFSYSSQNIQHLYCSLSLSFSLFGCKQITTKSQWLITTIIFVHFYRSEEQLQFGCSSLGQAELHSLSPLPSDWARRLKGQWLPRHALLMIGYRNTGDRLNHKMWFKAPAHVISTHTSFLKSHGQVQPKCSREVHSAHSGRHYTIIRQRV